MSQKNFYRYVDRSGNMPQMRTEKWDCASHPYYVRYVNDKPVAYHGPAEIHDNGQGKIYDYSKQEFVPIASVPSE